MVTHGIENQFTTRILPLEDATSVPPQGAIRALGRCGCHGVLRPGMFGVAPPVFNPHRGIHTTQIDGTQMSLLAVPEETSPAVEALENLDPDTLTPRQALEWIYRLKSLV